MSDRTYLFVVGMYILTALYLGEDVLIYVLACVMLLEGISGLTITGLSQKARNVMLDSGLLQYDTVPVINFEAFRALRIFFALVMTIAYAAVNQFNVEVIWFLPWFFGFAMLGAGISGVCPVLLAIKKAGFK